MHAVLPKNDVLNSCPFMFCWEFVMINLMLIFQITSHTCARETDPAKMGKWLHEFTESYNLTTAKQSTSTCISSGTYVCPFHVSFYRLIKAAVSQTWPTWMWAVPYVMNSFISCHPWTSKRDTGYQLETHWSPRKVGRIVELYENSL